MSDPTPLLSISSDQKQRIDKVQASSLSALIPKTYSTVKARVLIVKAKQKEDELGKRNYIFGICEDSTFRIPFICHKDEKQAALPRERSEQEKKATLPPDSKFCNKCGTKQP